MVLGLCRLLLRDPVEAEDAAQGTFLSAHRSLLRGAGPREPAPWLAAIARNECWSRMRARGGEPVGVVEPAGESPDPLAAAIMNADLGALWLALGELPRRQRRAFLLRELSGLSYGELAQALAVSEPAVESLLFRARQHVRTRLATAARAVGWPAALGAKLATAGVVGGVATVGAVQLGHDRPPPPRAPVVRAAPRPESRKLETLVRRPRLAAAAVALPLPAVHVERRRPQTVRVRGGSGEPAVHEDGASAEREIAAQPESQNEGEQASTSSNDRPSADGGSTGDGGGRGDGGGDANGTPGDD
jgi:RNA polymerase sigma-70 factor (ECF subfamily)